MVLKIVVYILTVLPNNTIKITLSYKDTRPIVIPTDEDNLIGVDINVKNNLFSTSISEEIDYDRDLFNTYVKFLKKLDKRKENKLNKKLTKQKNKWLVRIGDMLKRKSSELVNLAIENDKNHIVLEDLELMNSGFTRNDEFQGFKYSRLVRLLHLASLKKYIKSIAYKKGIAVIFVQPEYTSQTCRKCGNISKENRKTQEDFVCTSCNYTINADLNASINILDRAQNEDLKFSLLKKNKLGEYEPKNLKQYKIKEIVGDAYA